LSAVSSNPFAVTPAAAAQLVIIAAPPTSITAGRSFGLKVSAEDPFGNLATSFAGGVDISLASGPANITLAGTHTAIAGAGVADFSALSPAPAASGYTIQATATGLPSATTHPFAVMPAAASQLVITTPLPSSMTAGNSFGLAVVAEDAFGNLDS